jgi:hypothetical protein
MTDPAITGVSASKDAADKIHEAMHGIGGAASTMEGNLDTLGDMMAELEAPEAQGISAVVDGIRKNLDELKEANHVVHVQTDVILEGLEAGDLADMVETTHRERFWLQRENLRYFVQWQMRFRVQQNSQVLWSGQTRKNHHTIWHMFL